jgi:hypothetical protein
VNDVVGGDREGCPVLAVELVRRGAARHAKGTAVRSGDKSLTFAEVDEAANRMAHVLAGLGVARGARVGLLVDNGIWSVPVDFACLKAGAARVPLNARLAADEQARMLAATGVRLLVHSAAQAGRAGELAARLDGLRLASLGPAPEVEALDLVEEMEQASATDPGLPARQLVVLVGRKGVDRASRVPAQIMTLGRGRGDCSKQAAVSQDRAERVHLGAWSGLPTSAYANSGPARKRPAAARGGQDRAGPAAQLEQRPGARPVPADVGLDPRDLLGAVARDPGRRTWRSRCSRSRRLSRRSRTAVAAACRDTARLASKPTRSYPAMAGLSTTLVQPSSRLSKCS